MYMQTYMHTYIHARGAPKTPSIVVVLVVLVVVEPKDTPLSGWHRKKREQREFTW